MHIPDGYLSPKTCAVFFAGMLPVWYFASKRVESELKLKNLPLLALGAAFTFVIMMFNIPIPGGSSGHMVGSVVVAIALGPWAGVIALSLALILQAFLFGDGGVLAIGANSFNMAFVMSFAGYWSYRAASFGSPGRARKTAAAAIAGYAAVNLAALAVGIELGIQPSIAAGADGRPLYAPYPLYISIPAMMVPHALFLGPVEAIGTALVVSYMEKTMGGELARAGKSARPLWTALVVLAVLTPLGLLAVGTPWGEWGKSEILEMIGYVPSGMDRYDGAWKGVLPDYGHPSAGGRIGSSFVYIVSAAVGSLAAVLAIWLWGKRWRK
ncbi:MAG: cobalt transporter CbiM [Deltaproteobacteria bacterium]|nr:cobalt transporter CbiM [Deltaproteobacteria bacterium]